MLKVGIRLRALEIGKRILFLGCQKPKLTRNSQARSAGPGHVTQQKNRLDHQLLLTCKCFVGPTACHYYYDQLFTYIVYFTCDISMFVIMGAQHDHPTIRAMIRRKAIEAY